MSRRTELAGNLVRFGLVGGGTTLAAYLVFIGLLEVGAHYALASAAASAAGVALGYGLNRGFTFAVRTRPTAREAAGYLGTYVLQYLLALGVYAALIDGLGMAPSAAFAANLAITATFSFVVMRLFVFPWDAAARRPAQASAGASPLLRRRVRQ